MCEKAILRKSERDESFDFKKGILIFLVVYGHVIQFTVGSAFESDLIFSLIYTFHMPLFVFISGYFATHIIYKTMGECAKKVWHRLLVPALIWSVVQFLIFYWGGYGRGLDSMVMDSLRRVWFLYCIASLYLLGNCVFKFGNWKYPVAVVLIIVMYLCYNLPGVAYIEYFQPIRQWPLFVMGLFYYEHKKRLSPLVSKVLLAISAMVYVGLYVWLASNQPLEYICSADNYLPRAVIYQTGAILWFSVIKMLYRSVNTMGVASFISKIGRNTLGIYVINSKTLMLHMLILSPAMLVVIPQWLIALTTTFVLFGLTQILKTNKYTAEFLLGESHNPKKWK